MHKGQDVLILLREIGEGIAEFDRGPWYEDGPVLILCLPRSVWMEVYVEDGRIVQIMEVYTGGNECIYLDEDVQYLQEFSVEEIGLISKHLKNAATEPGWASVIEDQWAEFCYERKSRYAY